METLIIPFLIAIVIGIIIFLVLREVMLWYYKINERIKLQTRTNELLELIYIQLGGTIMHKDESKELVLPDGPPLPFNGQDLKEDDVLFVKRLNSNEKQYMTYKEWLMHCEEPFFKQNNVIITVNPSKTDLKALKDDDVVFVQTKDTAEKTIYDV